MKIYIEAGSFYGKRTGVGRYGLSITEELCKLRSNDEFVLFSFLRPGRQLTLDAPLPSNAQIKHIRWFPGRVFSLCMMLGIPIPLELFGLSKADVIFFPNFIAWPSILKKKRISVIHDVTFLHMPQFVQSLNLRYLTRQLPKTFRRSNAVVAVSEMTKKDLVDLKFAPAKITVAYNAVDHDVFNPDAAKQTTAVLKKLDLPNDYMLFVGTIEPRKNIDGLLEAYKQSFRDHKTPLVLVGGKGWNDAGIAKTLAEIKDLPVHTTGFVSDSDLAALYAGAKLFVYPSFYEGFGIPVLEAMASGCPVICSNNSAFPEVVGEAGLMVDPHNTHAIASAITKVLTNKTLLAQMVQSGLKQSKKFTWRDSAAILSQLIDEVAHG